MADMNSSIVIRVIETLLPGAVGAAISLKFMPGSWWNKALSFLGGVACSYYIGNGLIEYLNVTGKFSATAMLFTIGIFGLSIVNQIQQQLPEFMYALKRKWIGE